MICDLNFFLKATDYEIRQYEPAKWVCTSLRTIDWDAAINAGFMKLFNYIKGKNEKGNIQGIWPPIIYPIFFEIVPLSYVMSHRHISSFPKMCCFPKCLTCILLKSFIGSCSLFFG